MDKQLEAKYQAKKKEEERKKAIRDEPQTTGFSRRNSRRSIHKTKSAFAFSAAESGQKPGELIRQGTMRVKSPEMSIRRQKIAATLEPMQVETIVGVVSEKTTSYKDLEIF